MKKMLIGLALVAGTLAAGGAGASAVYPPGGPGTLTASRTCEYSDPPEPNLIHWTATVSYEVTAADTTLTVSDEGGVVLLTQPAAVGAGSVTFDIDSPGFESESGLNPLTATLSSSGAAVSELIEGCASPEIPVEPSTTTPTSIDPPESPGTVTISNRDCTYAPGQPDVITSWSSVISYDVTMADTEMTVTDPAGNVLYQLSTPVGAGSVTVGNTTPGFENLYGALPISAELRSGAAVSSYWGVGCPVPTDALDGSSATSTTSTSVQVNPPVGDPGTLTVVQPVCMDDPTDPLLGIKDWEFTVNYNVTAAGATLKIVSNSGTEVYSAAVPVGAGSLKVDESTNGFGSSAPYTFYTATLSANGKSVSAQIAGCPIPTTDTGNGTKATSTSTSTSTTVKPGGTLPKTGADPTVFAGIALAMVSAGAILALAARRNGRSVH